MDESESSTANVLHRIGEVILCHLLAQAPKQSRQSWQRPAEMISPDLIKNFIRREDARRARCEFFKQLHLTVRQGNGFFICQEDARPSVQREAADSHTALCVGSEAKIAG